MKPLNVVNGTSSIPGEIWNKIIDNRIPINASVFLTNDCNFKCRHCYVQSLKNKSQYPLSIDIWASILLYLEVKCLVRLIFLNFIRWHMI